MTSLHHTNGAAEEVAVVMVPLPAQGHLNQLLHLSRLISARGLAVHYVGSETHNLQAKHRVQGWDPLTTTHNIQFHHFSLPTLPLLSPDPTATDKFPIHLLPLFEASHHHFRRPLSDLLHRLSATVRRVVVVHDSLMSFAAHEASTSLLPNVEAYCFNSSSAFSSLYFACDFLGDAAGDVIEKSLCSASIKDCLPEAFLGFIARNIELSKFDVGQLYNTCEAIDGRLLEKVRKIENKSQRYWAVGPLNPISLSSGGRTGSGQRCIDWLDQQPPDSVLYVSFGTMTSVSDEQIAELGLGLEQSEQRFIWVVRDADRVDIYDQNRRVIKLPDGLEERVGERGVVVRDWAPQLEILAHKSTGGFMSHCGWNSCVESLSMGVPMAAWPMHSDQPMNTILVTEVMRVGMVAREWARREDVLGSGCVASVVKKLMVGEEGKELRKRAREVGLAIRQAVLKEGTSSEELDSFVAHITRSEETTDVVRV